jgi:hypothetical protein
MCPAQNGINMNDIHSTLPAAVELRLHHPHADVGARLIPNRRKSSDKRTWVFDATVLE